MSSSSDQYNGVFIDWGDGSARADASVGQISAGKYAVNGTHTYASRGQYVVRVYGHIGNYLTAEKEELLIVSTLHAR